MSDTPPNSPYDDEGQLVADTEPAPSPREKPMGFLDHLEELRWTLIKCAIVFAIFVTVIAYRMEDASTLLNWPLEQVKAEFPKMKTDLVTNSPMGVFTVIIDMCLIGGIVLALPFWIYFLGRFISPALNEKELRVIVPTGLSAFALFLGGSAFGYYFLTPNTIRVAFELNEMLGYTVMWTADKYYSLLMWMVLGMGAAFEFPLLVVLAVYMGLIEVATLRKFRRHAIVVIFIIAAVVTPTPDPFNQTLFALPLILLYEIAILVASRITARRKIRG
ncbi:MAG: twin-arginine translocase subunit TatC [Candidatus Didemnitutus sp.]|nr:twin-arginine translocase subunit TatC [Candidatus Didemnitutus sp.]